MNVYISSDKISTDALYGSSYIAHYGKKGMRWKNHVYKKSDMPSGVSIERINTRPMPNSRYVVGAKPESTPGGLKSIGAVKTIKKSDLVDKKPSRKVIKKRIDRGMKFLLRLLSRGRIRL